MSFDISAYSHIIWDFNGTLVDDVQLGIDCVNRLLEKRGLAAIKSREEYHAVFRYPIIDYYTRLGFDFSKESFDALAREWYALYCAGAPTAPLQPGVRGALERVRAAGKKQFIISASERGLMLRQLKALGIMEYFDGIVGSDNIYGESKIAAAQRWAQTEKPKRALFIGDLSHDLQTARAIGADCLLLACGHQSRSELEKLGVPVEDSAEELF